MLLDDYQRLKGDRRMSHEWRVRDNSSSWWDNPAFWKAVTYDIYQDGDYRSSTTVENTFACTPFIPFVKQDYMSDFNNAITAEDKKDWKFFISTHTWNGISKRWMRNSPNPYPVSPCLHIETEFSFPITPGIRDIHVDYDGGHFRDMKNFRDQDGNQIAGMIPEFWLSRIMRSPFNWGYPTDGPSGWQPFMHPEFRPTIPEEFEAELCLEAFNYYTTVFPQEISISEFLQGLYQIKDLLPQISENLLKTISGGYLNWKFGWESSFRDIEAISTIATQIQRRIFELRRDAGVPTRLGFSRENAWYPDNLEDYAYSVVYPCRWWEDNPLRYRCAIDSFKCDFRATAWITQSLGYLEGIMGTILGLLGSIGLQHPLRELWQIIPFSFVVDWFVDIESKINAFEHSHLPANWFVNDITHSMDYQISYGVYQTGLDVVNYPTGSFKSTTLTQKVYDRRVGLSVDYGQLALEDLNDNQRILLAAILHQFS